MRSPGHAAPPLSFAVSSVKTPGHNMHEEFDMLRAKGVVIGTTKMENCHCLVVHGQISNNDFYCIAVALSASENFETPYCI